MNELSEEDRIAVMRYVDREMSPDESSAFHARTMRELGLSQHVIREMALRLKLSAGFDPVLDEPVPAALLDLLAVPHTEAQVLTIRPVPTPPPAPAPAVNETLPAGTNDAHRAALPHARRWAVPQFAAMAACLVLGVLLGTRALGPRPAAGGDTLALNVAPDGAITAQGALRDALEQDVAGTVLDPNAKVGVGLSFRDRARDYCRTFTLDSASSGIACKQRDGWVVAHLEHGTNAREGEAGAYRTAASPLSPALLQAIDAMRDGDTLDAAAEAAAKAKGWKP